MIAMEQVLLALGLLLLFAKIFGNIVERFGVTSLAGEVVAGVVVGPVLGWVTLGDFLTNFMTISAAFLMFMAGMEVKFEDLSSNSYVAIFLALCGGAFSALFGILIGIIFFNDFLIGAAIGTVLTFTSNGPLFMMLMRANKFNTRIGKLIVAVTIADDMVGILAFSLFNMYLKSAISFSNLFFVALVSIGFYLAVMAVGSKKIAHVLDSIIMYTDESILFTIPVAIMFLLSFVTDNIGLSMLTGAFLAGISVANSKHSSTVIKPQINAISSGLLLPIFYASMGTFVVFTNLNPLIILGILAAALFGKIIGCGIMAWFTGADWADMKLIGISMLPRGDENIAILQIILAMGLITLQVYSSIAFALVITTVLAPVLMRVFIK